MKDLVLVIGAVSATSSVLMFVLVLGSAVAARLMETDEHA
jgi:hypothetical protein